MPCTPQHALAWDVQLAEAVAKCYEASLLMIARIETDMSRRCTDDRS